MSDSLQTDKAIRTVDSLLDSEPAAAISKAFRNYRGRRWESRKRSNASVGFHKRILLKYFGF